MGWDGHSGGVLLRFGGLFLRDLLKVGRERENKRELWQKAWWHGLLSDMLLHADHIADHIRERERHTHRETLNATNLYPLRKNFMTYYLFIPHGAHGLMS